jgi:hypothetical protein
LSSIEVSPTDRSTIPAKKRVPACGPKTQRSRVTNGNSYFVEADQRGPWARRWRDLLAEIISDVSSHNESGLSEGQRQLARRCATIAIECEKLEGLAAAGENIDLDMYGKMTDRLGRAFQRLGLKRQARDVSPTLSDYFRVAPP